MHDRCVRSVRPVTLNRPRCLPPLATAFKLVSEVRLVCIQTLRLYPEACYLVPLGEVWWEALLPKAYGV